MHKGVAFAATAAGVKSTIVMPRSAPIAKVSATQGYGAEVVLAGNIYDEAYAKACEICERPAQSSSTRLTMRMLWRVRAPSRWKSCAICRALT